jgi:peptide/nickel transport system permease protein
LTRRVTAGDRVTGSTKAVQGVSRRVGRLPLQFWLGAALILVLVVVAAAAPWVAPAPPNDMDLLSILTPPDGTASPPHWFGTDSLGRDVLSRLIWGARVALAVAFGAAVGAAVVGTALGLLAGALGGAVDWAISRLVDLWMSFPPVVLSLLLVVALGAGLDNVILAIVLVDWTRFCRVLRAEVMVIRRQDYVSAARLIGFGQLRIMAREIFPGIVPTFVTLVALEMGIAVRVEAVLSFVGMSVPADVPAWGQMIADARSDMVAAPWAIIAPIGAIVATVIGFNLLGDGLRRALDPRLLGRS